MASHTRLAILAFTVGTLLMVRETVAMETLARSATVRMSMRTGFTLAPRADLVFLVAMRARECVYSIPLYGKKSRYKSYICRTWIETDGRAALENVYQSQPVGWPRTEPGTEAFARG